MYIPEIKSETFIYWGEVSDYSDSELHRKDIPTGNGNTESKGGDEG